MTTRTATPTPTLDPRFSSPDATARPYADARTALDDAQLYWLATVRPDGRPHITPLIAVMVNDALHFCTGADERKAKNIAANAHCIIMTGCNRLDDGLDVVVEGEAVRTTDALQLARVADAYVEKYGEEWRFEVRDGEFHGAEGNDAIVFRIDPVKALGFSKGEVFSQTGWRF
jgi:hypothetical protein